nr:hypothetical protein MA16_Dca006990 [Tanacetum cinerariifolium]
WDDQLATQKQRSELEWENPFAAKRGEDHTVLHISEEKDDDLPYPKFLKFEQLAAQIVKKHEEHAFPTAADDAESSTSYQPPPDAIMRPAIYPPARQNPQQTYKPDYQIRGNACPTSRSRPMQWRTAYPGAYSALETIADDPQNITSQVRQLIIMEDPYRGSIDEQDRAYRDLDRITCEETKNLWSFLEDFRQLAIKSGKMYFPSTTEKLFAKLPPSLSKNIEESFKARHPGLRMTEEESRSVSASFVEGKDTLQKIAEENDEEIRRLKAQLQEKNDKETEVQFSKEEFSPLGNSQIARPFMEAE